MSGTIWQLGYVLPNISVHNPIERGYVALAPANDPRVQAIAANNRFAAELINNFADSYGTRVQPSALICQQDAPSTVNQQGIVAFRNSIAISAIVEGWGALLESGGSGFTGFPRWSEYFDIYPLVLQREGRGLITETPAVQGINMRQGFHGQTSPNLGGTTNSMNLNCDQLLLETLLTAWERRFARGTLKERKSRLLFRSLEVAYQASGTPTWNYSTINDYGTNLGLWVSAFEVLTHPSRGDANLLTVLNLLGRANFDDPALRAKRFKIKYRRVPQRINLLQKLYKELYDARNDFLHGNEIKRKHLFPFHDDNKYPLTAYAPLIYGKALECFLIKPSTRERNSPAQLRASIVNMFRDSRYERALLTARSSAPSFP